MRLLSIRPQHFGAFSGATSIKLDRDVTIFTGPNDSGKSCALAAVRMLCVRTKGEERHVNTDRIGHFSGPWNSDPEITIAAEAQVTDASEKSFKGDIKTGDIVEFQYRCNQVEQGFQILSVQRGGTQVSVKELAIRKMPKPVEFQPSVLVGSTINLAQMNRAEEQLLKLAFGAQFSAASIQSLSAHARSVQVDRAQETLNAKLRTFFPKAMGHRFRLNDLGAEGKTLGVSLVDVAGGFSAVESRGTGVRRLITLMGFLLQEVNPDENTVVLLDEPETSLHADAQHQLRQTLERLAESPRIQVIYATHSPSMVNPAHPERIRVFSRTSIGGVARTDVEVPRYGENFQRVRVSLGLTPADSLLYGLVTVLVEGDTEARCLAVLLKRLEAGGVDGFQGVSVLLDSCHFVACAGDSISYYCKLAMYQKANPIVFLDGDKANVVASLRRDRPDVPVVTLPMGQEFENLVPARRYISGVASTLEQLGKDVSGLTSEEFEAWQRGANLPERMMFSKRIDRWVADVTGGSYNKHAAMEESVRQTESTEIQLPSLAELVRYMREQIK